MSDVRTVSGWITDLANLTAGSAMMREIKPRIAGLASMLADNFPAAAFSRKSLEHVARGHKFFPSYSEICDSLAAWWKANQPPVPVIAADQNATIRQREIERQVRESWEIITADQVRAKIRAVSDSVMPATLGSFLASALAKHAPHHLGLLPPAWLKDQSEPTHVAAMRRPAAALTMTSEVKRAKANDEDWRNHLDAKPYDPDA